MAEYEVQRIEFQGRPRYRVVRGETPATPKLFDSAEDAQAWIDRRVRKENA